MKYKKIMNETSLVGSVQKAQHLHYYARIYRKNDREKGKIKMFKMIIKQNFPKKKVLVFQIDRNPNTAGEKNPFQEVL